MKQISTHDVYKWIRSDDKLPPLIIDCRTKEEFEVSHLKNAEHFEMDSDWSQNLKGISKEKSIVIYCSVGYRSSLVARQVQKLGFNSVYNLEGSIFKWFNEGKYLVDNKGIATSKIHPYDKKWSEYLIKKYN